jgi:hypothetical protein
MARGARNTAITAQLIAGSTHSSNAELRFRGLADFASVIHSHALPPNREGAIGVTGRKIKFCWTSRWDTRGKKPNEPVERFGVPLFGKLLN